MVSRHGGPGGGGRLNSLCGALSGCEPLEPPEHVRGHVEAVLRDNPGPRIRFGDVAPCSPVPSTPPKVNKHQNK